MQVRERPPEPPSRINPRLPRTWRSICLKCLEKDPQRRYASAQALAEDLRRYLAGEPILARPIGRIERAVLWVRRKPAIAGLIAAVVIAVAGGLLGTSVGWFAALRAAQRRTGPRRMTPSSHRPRNESRPRSPGGAGRRPVTRPSWPIAVSTPSA